MTRAGRAEEGSFSVELAVGWTIILLGVLVVAVAYQVRHTTATVSAAAREAARAASLTADPAQAARAADRLARDRLTGRGCADGGVDVTVNTTAFRAGGVVEVTVACRTRPLLGPSRHITAHADEIIDRYRGGLP